MSYWLTDNNGNGSNVGDSAAWYVQLNDFDDVSTVGTTDPWTLGQVGGAGTATIGDGPYGEVVLATTAADNKGPFIVRDAETFTCVAYKDLELKTRFKANSASESGILIGFSDVATTPITNVTTLAGIVSTATVDNFIGFAKPEGSGAIYLVAVLSDVQTSIGPIATITADTYNVFGLKVSQPSVQGTGSILAYVNGVYAGAIATTALPTATTTLRAGAAVVASSATGSTCTIDYIHARQQR